MGNLNEFFTPRTCSRFISAGKHTGDIKCITKLGIISSDRKLFDVKSEGTPALRRSLMFMESSSVQAVHVV